MLILVLLPPLLELRVPQKVHLHLLRHQVRLSRVLVFQQVLGHLDVAHLVFVLDVRVVVDDGGPQLSPVAQDPETNAVHVVYVMRSVPSSNVSSLRYFPFAIESVFTSLVSVLYSDIWYTSPLTCPGSSGKLTSSLRVS